MLVIPQKGRILMEQNTGSVGTATPGTAATTDGASSATKGTPAEIFAATSFDAFWITIIASTYGTSATASKGAMDILIGAATEEVLIADLLMGQCSSLAVSSGGPRQWNFPLYIPAGSRIAVQAAGERLATAVRVWVYLYGGTASPNFRVGGKVTTYGMGTVPTGTAITPGASGAEGSWTEITASTSQDHFAIMPSFQLGTDTNTTAQPITVDVGFGAATEESIMEGYWYKIDAAEQMGGPWPAFPCFQDIPSGSRLVMRASNTGANDTGYNGVLHCVS